MGNIARLVHHQQIYFDFEKAVHHCQKSEMMIEQDCTEVQGGRSWSDFNLEAATYCQLVPPGASQLLKLLSSQQGAGWLLVKT